MARRKDLTALAALGTLGYMMSKKGDKASDKASDKVSDKKGSVTESQIRADRDANEQKTSGDKEDMFIEPGSGPHGQQYDDELPGASAPSRVSATVKKPVVKTTAKPATKTPAYVQSYTEDMMEADNPRSVKTEKAPVSASTPAAKPATAAKLASSSRVPTSEQAAANRSAAMDKIKGVGSSIGDYFGNLTSTSRYMKKKPEGEYRHGGKVKKMASGGMTSSASKRADGIATKGKTRGKIY